MELLDIYDENMRPLGSAPRDEVHSKGLWHKTIHCWLYDDNGNIFFQIRKDSKKLYTTASGHVRAGESLAEAFAREIKEEIGIRVDVSSAELIEINAWRMDKVKNGAPFIDRAFANVYMNRATGKPDFKFDSDEVLGVVRVNAKECLKLLLGEADSIGGTLFAEEIAEIRVSKKGFLVVGDEIAIIKYGKILQAVIAAAVKGNSPSAGGKGERA